MLHYIFCLPFVIIFHLAEHAIQFFHFLDPLNVLLTIAFFVFPWSFRWSSTFLLPLLMDIVDCVNVDEIANWWRVKFLKSISDFFFLCKLQKVLKTSPFLILLINWQSLRLVIH